MKRWIKRSLFGLFGATILIGGLSACGHHHGHYGANMSAEDQAKFKEKMVDRVGSKLDLNADQKVRLSTLADKLQDQRKALVGQTTNPRAEMQALVAGDKFDRTKAQSLIADKTAAVTTKSPEVIAALADFYDSLNATQQAKVRDYMQGRHGWWHRG